MNEIWNEICFEIQTSAQNNVLEKEFENTVAACIALLGWKKYMGEITTQYAIQVGHEKKLADIVVLKDGIEQFVIEVKRPNHTLQAEDEKQLFSYMRLLRHQVSFGIYIGEKIHLYYDDQTSHQLPERVLSIDITKDNPNGVKFVELFSKATFDIDTLASFCKSQKEIMKEQQQILDETNKIIADTEGAFFRKLLKEHYLKEGHTENWIEQIMNSFVINIRSSVSETPTLPETNYQPFVENRHDKGERDKTKFSIFGGKPLAKNRFVLAVVTKYVQDHPMRFDEYVRIFQSVPCGSFQLIEPLQRAKAGRYFTEPNECLKSTDGITFAVCTQWKIDNIEPVVRFANQQGYNVQRHNNQ